ncbi:3-hydroxyacyl-CoA dehydrogenase [Faunimonas pinastri]|uniref:3-hydroxyacyl-CoA dehydrogenase n=1 Tax=Faunimonas pinastri TaxID=1855383 RepID=A0A1H9EBQ9_9HYPH|nr:3-hydroxyacyl-CoA dehydrogenase NAD-binding domain-containing protein [Faunimonas pinastri]SEQ23184.1 3-hydroxyacyl-CoA dehydrogenase [Faunimonas pinastri]
MTSAERAGTVRVERPEEQSPDWAAIALVTIDYPPVNAGSESMRRDLLDVFERLSGEAGLTGIVLTGASGNFVGGSDIREFDAPARAPHLPEVIAAIEACPMPVVAAIDGAALGGGYELALGCDARVATRKAVLGLPEVTLGLIPGAGGTLRLSRLVGVAKTIDLVVSGRRVKAAEALHLGMVDALVEGDLLSAALVHLKTLAGAKRLLRDLPPASSSETDIAEAEAVASKRGKGAVAVAEAIAAVKASAVLPPQQALEQERATSLRLRVGPQSKALRHLFFAERAAAKLPGNASPRQIASVGVVGAGQMGQGIAIAFAQRGFRVALADTDRGCLDRAAETLKANAAEQETRGRIRSADELMALIAPGEIDAMTDCDLFVEAITENMEAKKALFARLDALAKPGAILVSNTSYLDIDEIARATDRPGDVAGLHFFNPAAIMRLVEVVQTAECSPEVLATLVSVARRLGKVPVVTRVSEGFIGNRIFNAYRRQCEFLVEEGSSPEDVDRVMRDFGMAMGPFAVFDLAGLDIAWATRKRLAPMRDPRARYVEVPDRLCEAGRFGRKTGRGWYDYSADPRGVPDPNVRTLINEASTRKGIARRTIPDAEIRDRLLATLVNEAALLLDEGVAQRPSDIDLVLVNGYGFPALKGGPLHWAARQPRAEILSMADGMVAASGCGTERATNLEAVLDAAE